MVQTTRYSTNFYGKQVEQLKSKIWFRDSAVICEFRIEMQSIGVVDKGRIVKTAYPIAAYYYLDLRTMRAQQYHTFKDTAMPMYNIRLNNGSDFPGWLFYHSNKSPLAILEEKSALPDTTIKNILYKRVKIEYKKTQDNSYYVHYLKCNIQKNIFHINPELEKEYPGCKSFRSEYVHENVVVRAFEYSIVRDSLTKTEIDIFNSWGNHAKKTTLPILTFQEVISKGFSENIKFDEEPTITILPHDSTFLKPQPITKITEDDVKRWLNKNISPSAPIKNTLIKKVLQNALFNKMYAEILHEDGKEKLVIIPLKDRPVSQHYTDKNSTLQYLIIVENEKGEIRRSDLVLFYPYKFVSSLAKNTFFNLFNSDFNSEDGTYAVISLGDKKQFEIDFKKNQKTEYRIWTSNHENNQKNKNCQSWYLETTKYFHFGQIEQTKKLLGNTCTGCPPNQLCDKTETSGD